MPTDHHYDPSEERSSSRWTLLSIVLALMVLGLGIGLASTHLLSDNHPTTSSKNGFSDQLMPTEGSRSFAQVLQHCLAFIHQATWAFTPSANDETRVVAMQTDEGRPETWMASKRAQDTLRQSKPPQESELDTVETSMRDSFLWRHLSDGSFWHLLEDDLIGVIHHEFPEILERLKTAYALDPIPVPRPNIPSLSERLFNGRNYDEINRTLLGILALRWIVTNDYESFTQKQKPAVRLTAKSFGWLHAFYTHNLVTPMDTYALILSMAANDIGKDAKLDEDYHTYTGENMFHVNHDMKLLLAIQAGMVPEFNKLSQNHSRILMDGIILGAELNFGQLAQAENAPASLVGFRTVDTTVLNSRLMEQILDVAGAAGHGDWTAPTVMKESVFQAYFSAYDAAVRIQTGDATVLEGYNIVLQRKLDLLARVGLRRGYDLHRRDDRALVRVFCMAGIHTPEQAALLHAAFYEALSVEDHEDLTYLLNVHGSTEEPAIQPTYAPGMLKKAMSNTPNGTPEEQVRAVSAFLGYLAKVMRVPCTVGNGVTVVEREIRFIEPVLQSEAFKRGPEILLEQGVPRDQVANQVRS